MIKSSSSKGKWMTLSAAVLTTFLLQSQTALAQEQATTSSSSAAEQLDDRAATETQLSKQVTPTLPEAELPSAEAPVAPEVVVPESEESPVAPEVELESDASASAVTPSESVDQTENAVVPSQAKPETLAESAVPSSPAAAEPATVSPVREELQPSSATVADKEVPQTIESNAIINVQPLWDSNVKGQGTVVAIIDSGLDVTHDVLRITELEAAKYKSKEEFEAVKAAAGINYGKWYNDKVVFGYNYNDVNEELKEKEESSHGMHVSGIAVGNPSKKDSSGSYIKGVAPEAQLMFMRVFTDKERGTAPYLYVRAIDDAVKLGADTINLSLGSPNGDLNDMYRTIDAAIERARQAGVTVVIAAGNDSYFGEGHALPDADKPDYGVVASPSVARGSISVASYNNTHVTSEIITIVGMEGNEAFNGGKVFFSHPADSKAKFVAGKEYTYEYVGRGKVEDLEGKDLTGKLALIERGDITFAEKVKNAKTKNAIGAIIFNNGPGGAHSVTMRFNDPVAASIPSLFIAQDVGKELAANSSKYKIRVDGHTVLAPNPDAGKMSSFTSWGLSADGELKPDVTAPGGAIYSAINDGKYGSQDGTSMASPHIAGVMALMKQYYAERFPDLKGQALQTLIKQVLMSTAVPHVNPETGVFTSPRQQGAGIADTAKAVHSDLYVTGQDGYSSISLGNVKDVLEFTLTLNNLSDQDKTVHYVSHLNTDTVKAGKITTQPRELLKTEAVEIVVPAKGKVLVPIKLDATAFAEELTQAMVNGYYLEGFVRFLDSVDGGELVSIPFVGFRGQFENLAVLEKPIYDMKEGDKPFYYTVGEDGHLPQKEDSDFTALVSAVSEWDHLAGEHSMPLSITLGTYENEAGHYTIKRGADGQPIFAISPNGDGNRDGMALRGVFLRNYENLKFSVYKADDTNYQAPLWESMMISGDKNFHSGQATNPKSSLIFSSEFLGKDKDGKTLADGDYVYVASYLPAVPGASEQRTSFKFKIDTAMPALTTGTLHVDQRYFKPRPSIETGSGIYRERLYYVLEPKTDENGQPVDDSAYADQMSETKRVYIKRNEDGSYTLPEKDLRGDDLRVSHFWYATEDHAGNTLSSNLSEYQALGNDMGIVNIRLVDEQTGKALEGIAYRYTVRDSQGKLVNESTQVAEGSHKMPFGDYTVELFLHDEEYARIVGPTKLSFSVGENNTLQAVDFKAKLLSYETFRLVFEGELPEGSKVFAVDQSGKREELPRGRYVTNIYEKKLLIEPHTIQIELPRAYKASENNFVYHVLSGTNIKHLDLYAKGDLTKDGEALLQPEKPAFDLAADDDGDGFTNEEELVAKTDPLDGQDVPEVTAKGDSLIQPSPATIDLDGDSDGDGFSNRVELTHGSDLFDATSVPNVSAKGSSVVAQPRPKLPLADLKVSWFQRLIGSFIDWIKKPWWGSRP